MPPFADKLNGKLDDKLDGRQVIIFSDLDGTLLDHENYSFEPARQALEFLKDHKIPLVLASSKTAAEIGILRHKMGFDHCPAIVENGAGILPQNAQAGEINSRYPDIIRAINGIPSDLRQYFKGFSDWSSQDVAKMTGLSLEDAQHAKNRQFSEPGLWSGSEDQWHFFKELASEQELIAQQGGRFRTMSFGGNKADRVAELKKSFATKDKPCFAIALGDASNDIAMLEAADFGIIVKNSAHHGIPILEGEARHQIIRTSLEGPDGWNDSLLKLFSGSY